MSEKYENVKYKYKWKCKEGHVWTATADSVINQNSWCPTCASQRKITIEELRAICESRGGVLLSGKYINVHTKYEVKCREGHIFYPQGQSLIKGYWCKKCSSTKLWLDKREKVTLNDYINAGKVVGCELLSNPIPDRTIVKALWKCYAKGHVFKMTYNNMKNHKQNCPKCQGKGKVTQEDCANLAIERNGKFISDKYNPYELQLWECKHGHRFSAKYSTIKSQNIWCPYCTQSVGERAVRYVLETIFQQEFKKTRPEWLVNKEGKRLELDGFCEELGLAFEHNGKQHYSSKYHRGTPKLMENDAIKKALCQLNHIVLLIVPEVPSLMKFEDLSQYLIGEIKLRGIQIPTDVIIPKLDSSFRWTETIEEDRLRRLERARNYINDKRATLIKSEFVRRNKQYIYIFDIQTIGGGYRRITEHRLFNDDLLSTKRIDPLTKEEFYPRNGKQKFANIKNSWKYNNQKKNT